MPGFVSNLSAAAMAALATVFGLPAADAAPRRVVSMNVCTDQLAMLVADDGQLHSVSYLASDPAASVMAQEAGAYVLNHGLAEEILLMRPDLVIAGTYTTRVTVDLLRRLGFRVEEFAPEADFDDVRDNILRMGGLLGRRHRAAELVAELDRGLAELAAAGPLDRSVAIYSSNSYIAGPGSLSHAVVEVAGLRNVAAEMGIAGSGRVPLEALVMAAPDLVIGGGREYGAPALAQQGFDHPAFRALASAGGVTVPDNRWICGAPFTLEAARIVRAAAEAAR